VIAIAAFAIAQERDIAVPLAFEENKPRAFADGDPIAGYIARPARVARYQLQRGKTVEDGEAEAVDPADDRRITKARAQIPASAGKDLGAR
jgi:hypothetical protein